MPIFDIRGCVFYRAAKSSNNIPYPKDRGTCSTHQVPEIFTVLLKLKGTVL